MKIILFSFCRRACFDDNRTYRVTISNAFARGNNMWTQVIVHISKPFSCSSNSACYFIHYNYHIIFSGKGCKCLNKIFRRQFNQSRTVSRLKYKCAYL